MEASERIDKSLKALKRMENSKTIKSEQVEKVVDHETGEVKSERKKVTYRVANEPDFVKVYLKDLLYLFGLPKYHAGVLYWLMQNCNYSNKDYGLCVVLNAALKKNIMSDLSIKSIGTIDNILSELTKRNVIERVDTGIYRLNPYLFGRGDWRDILEIRLNVRYNIEGKTIEGTMKKEMAEKKSEEEQRAYDEHLVKVLEESRQNFYEELATG